MTARSLLLGERNPLRRRRPSASVGPRRSVTFPTSTRLVTRVQIALGADLTADPLTWSWLDITPWVRYDLGISLTTGRRDEATQLTTGSARMKLDNRDGRFTRRNPTGPYYGLLSKNTPIWVTVDAGSGEKTRLEMFVNEWPTRWSDKSASDSTVTIQCAGVLRRLAQGRVLKSGLRRLIESDDPYSYWALDDGVLSLSGKLTSGVGGDFGASLWNGGTVNPGSAEVASWLGTGLELNGFDEIVVVEASLPGALSPTSRLVLDATVLVNLGTTNEQTTTLGILNQHTNSSVSASQTHCWAIQCDFDTGTISPVLIAAFGTPGSPSVVFSNGSTVAFDETVPHHLRIDLTQNGANIDAIGYLDGTSFGSGTLSSNTLTAFELSIVRLTHYGLGTDVGATVVYTDVAVWVDATPPTISRAAEAALGFNGESAADRVNRLCGEENIPCEVHASDSASMGPQNIDTLVNILQECAAADLGALYEKRWGLGYKSLDEFYNQPVSMALDFDQGHIGDLPEPADDDQRTRNKWSVSRADGQEATAEEDSGPLGTGAQGPGVYDDSTTVNVEADSQLANIANWLVHIGTVDEDRWPAIGLNFARSLSLIDTFTSLGWGARITVANPPSQMPQDDLDLVIEGYSEFWNTREWTASLNCSPASVFRVHVVGSTDGNLGRVDAANSTLAADVSAVATSLSVASPGALWRTGAVNFDINVAGERMTVTNISGGSSPQTFTVTRSVNGVVKAQYATVGGFSTKVSLWQPGVYALL